MGTRTWWAHFWVRAGRGGSGLQEKPHTRRKFWLPECTQPMTPTLFGRQFFCLDGRAPQVLEPGFVIWNRFIERSETRRQNLDAVKIGPRFIKGEIEFALHPLNCRLRSHNSHVLTVPWG